MADEHVPEVADSAFKHGVHLLDIEHAYRQRVARIDEDDMVIWLGASRTGTPLEIGVGRAGRIVHADTARPKYLARLRKPARRKGRGR